MFEFEVRQAEPRLSWTNESQNAPAYDITQHARARREADGGDSCVAGEGERRKCDRAAESRRREPLDRRFDSLRPVAAHQDSG
jgi:hypothetical protein